MHAVIRVLPPDYVDLLNTNEITPQKQNFLNMMIEGGHVDYCVMCGVNLLYDTEPDVEDVRRVLNIASVAEAEVVDYFLMLLDASAKGGKNIDRAVSTFTRFFQAQKLSTLRLHMVGWGTPY